MAGNKADLLMQPVQTAISMAANIIRTVSDGAAVEDSDLSYSEMVATVAHIRRSALRVCSRSYPDRTIR
jgi:hypothetical protein